MKYLILERRKAAALRESQFFSIEEVFAAVLRVVEIDHHLGNGLTIADHLGRGNFHIHNSFRFADLVERAHLTNRQSRKSVHVFRAILVLGAVIGRGKS